MPLRILAWSTNLLAFLAGVLHSTELTFMTEDPELTFMTEDQRPEALKDPFPLVGTVCFHQEYILKQHWIVS